MGGVAASGGYWISMGCDKIVAQPSTITGSIGVVSAAPDLSKVFEKVGISVEVVGYGPHAEELSMMRDGLSPLMKEKIQSSMQRIYGEFVRKASAGRKLDPSKLEPNARGRVWTGRKAKEIGLVDGLGGLQDAITMACFLGGHLDPQTTPVLELPEAPGLFEQLEEAFSGLASTRTLLQGLAREAGVAEALPRLEAVLGRDGGANGRLDAPRFLCLMPELFRRR
jgi:protease-4